MSMVDFGDWLYATPVSTAIRETSWIIPNLQSIHILAIAVLVGSALVTELRFAGVLAVDRPVGDVMRRFLPWMRWALLVLLLTGVVLVVAEPGRTLTNTVFLTKMALVAGASLVTLQARKSLLVASPVQEGETSPAEASKALAWLMLVVWCLVIFCGRFIAYV
ncbi:MAG: hypothetical protein KKD64_07000 [Alphaproteobacteria bacterium]|nr:hypothetical protein [Alphaproteobacteria bacterium]MBU0795241.1 hypothetical protein [Alphaproteobacteria bacterium]MBU0876683.1 hypothetical protein [Alphaproteobacteria bacterium]MBU1769385.1 hypothetical protein [Alphaproteobacteria bacterium]